MTVKGSSGISTRIHVGKNCPSYNCVVNGRKVVCPRSGCNYYLEVQIMYIVSAHRWILGMASVVCVLVKICVSSISLYKLEWADTRNGVGCVCISQNMCI